MSKVLITESYLQDIADAIREKAGGNNTYTPAQMATAITNIPSGGTSNIITGTFTTQSTGGEAQTITIPYTETGYPIFIHIEIKNGMYNSGSNGNTTWYNLIQRYAIGQFTITKNRPDETPTYTTSGTQNQAYVTSIYKSSASSATSYGRSGSTTANSYSSTSSSASVSLACRFLNNTTLSVFVASTSYGLVADTQYQYIIEYSS